MVGSVSSEVVLQVFTKISLSLLAEKALTAFSKDIGSHPHTWFKPGFSLTDCDNIASEFVTQNHGRREFWMSPAVDFQIGSASCSSLNTDKNLTRSGFWNWDFLQFKLAFSQ
jgi:hypothetical protein